MPWEGFVLSVSKIGSLAITSLHNQDITYNMKYLINPLDSPVHVLQLGEEVCFLEYVRQMYKMFTFD
jgi:hypothetical protein